MQAYPRHMERLIRELAKMPGIGRKTAERLAYYILGLPEQEARELSSAIEDLKKSGRSCSKCFGIGVDEVCQICADPRRDNTVICVVEEHKDLFSIEKTGHYKGVYHVLLGHISPLDNIHPEDLTIERLMDRIKNGGVREVILAMNFNVEGDTTALYIQKRLSALDRQDIKITRPARGIPQGSYLEYLSSTVLADAIDARMNF
ncbi:MAG TPA: recombination mediator RecR [Candidatus Avalokitesvara rifleensis]|uniref:recombination mediator RecR n=1 Tax=Candidatus Avalokitesvara rifleensis TaxID=3367620 RepID=UPI002713E270|nr:recombination mediator RecR [Candidatus Brocadiales bacterium]